jgi:hypothetical protein
VLLGHRVIEAEEARRLDVGSCLDWLLIPNRRHLQHVLRVFVDHYG